MGHGGVRGDDQAAVDDLTDGVLGYAEQVVVPSAHGTGRAHAASLSLGLRTNGRATLPRCGQAYHQAVPARLGAPTRHPAKHQLTWRLPANKRKRHGIHLPARRARSGPRFEN